LILKNDLVAVFIPEAFFLDSTGFAKSVISPANGIFKIGNILF